MSAALIETGIGTRIGTGTAAVNPDTDGANN